MSRSPSFAESLKRLGGRHQLLGTWLAQQKAWRPPDKVSVQLFQGQGAGLAASAPISRGETIMSVPEEVWRPFSARFAVETAEAKVPQFVAHVRTLQSQLQGSGVPGASRFPEHVALALQLAFDARDPAGGGHGYVASLPGPDVPLLWPESALSALQGTGVDAAVRGRKDFMQAAHGFLFPQGNIPYPVFANTLSLILSRALSETSGTLPYTLVPALDLANHSLSPGCTHNFDAERRAFTLVARRPHSPGDQITISYGNLSNDRLLRIYGFALDGNPNDTVQLALPWLQGVADRGSAEMNALLMQAAASGASDEAKTALGHAWVGAGMVELDAKLTRFAGVLAATRIALLQPGDVPGGSPLGGGPAPDPFRPLSPRNEGAAAAALREAIEGRLLLYPRSLAEDEAAWEQAAARVAGAGGAGSGGSSEEAGAAGAKLAPHEQSVLAVRVGQMRILQAALALLSPPPGQQAGGGVEAAGGHSHAHTADCGHSHEGGPPPPPKAAAAAARRREEE